MSSSSHLVAVPIAPALPKGFTTRLRERCIVFRHRHRVECQPFLVHETGDCTSPVGAVECRRTGACKAPTEYSTVVDLLTGSLLRVPVGSFHSREYTGYSPHTGSSCACVREKKALGSNPSRMRVECSEKSLCGDRLRKLLALARCWVERPLERVLASEILEELHRRPSFCLKRSDSPQITAHHGFSRMRVGIRGSLFNRENSVSIIRTSVQLALGEIVKCGKIVKRLIANELTFV